METKVYTAVNKLIKINREHKRLIDSQVAELGIHRTRHRMLMYLARNGNLPSQKKLSEYFEVTPSAITGALQKLECDGYIERRRGEDNRFQAVTITKKGRDVVERTRALFSAVDESLFAGFSEEELQAFVGYLERILENLKGEEAHEKMV